MWNVIFKYPFVEQSWLEHVSVRRSRKNDNHTASPSPSVIAKLLVHFSVANIRDKETWRGRLFWFQNSYMEPITNQMNQI